MNPQNIVKTLEIVPVIGFGISYFYVRDLILPTLVMMGLYTLFVIIAALLRVKLTKVQWMTWAVVVVLGTATVTLQNEQIIKWKTTIINTCVATAFLLSQWIGKKTLTERLLVDLAKLHAEARMLRNVNTAVIIYLLGIGALNLFIAYQLDTDTWVQFKLFGMFLINTAFFGGCIFYLREPIKELLERLEQEKKNSL